MMVLVDGGGELMVDGGGGGLTMVDGDGGGLRRPYVVSKCRLSPSKLRLGCCHCCSA